MVDALPESQPSPIASHLASTEGAAAAPQPSTRALILQAARVVLQRDGVANLSIRSVATEAGVNLALIHYHFHSRNGLLLAVLEQLDSELLARQRAMYAQPGMSLASRWRQAVEFYRQDLDSGYVRTLLELFSYGYSNPQMAERLRRQSASWRELLTQVAAEALTNLRVSWVEPEEVVSMLASFWYGMEMQHLLGVPEDEGRLWQVLETLGRLIERLEQSTPRVVPTARPRRPRGGDYTAPPTERTT